MISRSGFVIAFVALNLVFFALRTVFYEGSVHKTPILWGALEATKDVWETLGMFFLPNAAGDFVRHLFWLMEPLGTRILEGFFILLASYLLAIFLYRRAVPPGDWRKVTAAYFGASIGFSVLSAFFFVRVLPLL